MQHPVSQIHIEMRNLIVLTLIAKKCELEIHAFFLAVLRKTWPLWFASVICSDRIKWREAPGTCKVSDNFFLSTPSNAFDEFTLTIHNLASLHPLPTLVFSSLFPSAPF